MGGFLPFDQFLCLKLKSATLATAFYIILFATAAAILEILDIADQLNRNFRIAGGFKAEWRMHVWEGWLACNVVMLVAHLFMVIYSIVMVFAIKRFPTFYEYALTRLFLWLLIIYTIIELGTGLYHYTWYGPNTFRLAYLVFTFLYWVIRTILNLIGAMITYSRINELEYEIQYGEKKNLNPYMPLDMRSGFATPSGIRTPHSYA